MSLLLQLDQVSRQYDGNAEETLKDVSFSLQSGEFVALMGPSGCGKSTLLNIAGAIDKPTKGEIRLQGIELSGLNDGELTIVRREKMGFIFQFFNLLPTMTVYENIALPLEILHKPTGEIKHRVEELLEQVTLQHRRNYYPDRLSGGEMQRVAIARALANKPALILADEPTGNLDSETGVQILSLLTELAGNKQTAILMATHDKEAASACDRVIHIRDGRLQPEKQSLTP